MAYESTIAIKLETRDAEDQAKVLAQKIQEKLSKFNVGISTPFAVGGIKDPITAKMASMSKMQSQMDAMAKQIVSLNKQVTDSTSQLQKALERQSKAGGQNVIKEAKKTAKELIKIEEKKTESIKALMRMAEKTALGDTVESRVNRWKKEKNLLKERIEAEKRAAVESESISLRNIATRVRFYGALDTIEKRKRRQAVVSETAALKNIGQNIAAKRESDIEKITKSSFSNQLKNLDHMESIKTQMKQKSVDKEINIEKVKNEVVVKEAKKTKAQLAAIAESQAKVAEERGFLINLGSRVRAGDTVESRVMGRIDDRDKKLAESAKAAHADRIKSQIALLNQEDAVNKQNLANAINVNKQLAGIRERDLQNFNKAKDERIAAYKKEHADKIAAQIAGLNKEDQINRLAKEAQQKRLDNEIVYGNLTRKQYLEKYDLAIKEDEKFNNKRLKNQEKATQNRIRQAQNETKALAEQAKKAALAQQMEEPLAAFNKQRRLYDSLARQVATNKALSSTWTRYMPTVMRDDQGKVSIVSQKTKTDKIQMDAELALVKARKAYRAGDVEEFKKYTAQAEKANDALARHGKWIRASREAMGDFFSLTGRGFSKLIGIAGIGGLIASFTSIYTTINAVKGAFDKLTEANSVIALFSSITGSMEGARVEIDWLIQSSKKMGVSFGNAALPFAKFASAAQDAFSTEQIRGMYENVQKVALAMHMGAEETKGLFYALQQMLSKGTVSAEELKRQFAERVPGAMTVAAESMGMSLDDFLKKLHDGLIRSNRFVEPFLKAIGERFSQAAQIAGDSFYGAFARMETAWSELWMKISTGGVAPEAFKRLFNKITEIIDNPAFGAGISRLLTGVLDTVTHLLDSIQKAGIEKIFNQLVSMAELFLNWIKKIGDGFVEISQFIKELKVTTQDFKDALTFTDKETGRSKWTQEWKDSYAKMQTFMMESIDPNLAKATADQLDKYVIKTLVAKGVALENAVKMKGQFKPSDELYAAARNKPEYDVIQSEEFQRKINAIVEANKEAAFSFNLSTEAANIFSGAVASATDKQINNENKLNAFNTSRVETEKNLNAQRKKMYADLEVAKGNASKYDIEKKKTIELEKELTKVISDQTDAQSLYNQKAAEVENINKLLASGVISQEYRIELTEKGAKAADEATQAQRKLSQLVGDEKTTREAIAKSTGEYSAAMKEHARDVLAKQKDIKGAEEEAAQMAVDLAKIQAREFDATTMSAERLRQELTSMGEDYSNLIKASGGGQIKPSRDIDTIREELDTFNKIIEDIKSDPTIKSIEPQEIGGTVYKSIDDYRDKVAQLNEELANVGTVADEVSISFTKAISDSAPLIDKYRYWVAAATQLRELYQKRRGEGAGEAELEPIAKKFQEAKGYIQAFGSQVMESMAASRKEMQATYESAMTLSNGMREIKDALELEALSRGGMPNLPILQDRAQELQAMEKINKDLIDNYKERLTYLVQVKASSMGTAETDKEILQTQEAINGLEAASLYTNKQIQDVMGTQKDIVQETAKYLSDLKESVGQGWDELTLGSRTAELNLRIKRDPEHEQELRKLFQEQELQDFVRNAGLAMDDLSATFSDTFSSILDGTKSFTEAMGEMFDNLIDNIINASMRLVTDNLLGLLSPDGKGSWANLGIGAAVLGGAMLFKSFNKTAKMTPSPTMRETQYDVGVSEMKTADIFGRQTGFEYASRAAAEFNAGLRELELTVVGNIDHFASVFSGLGDKISALPIFKQVASIVEPVTNAVASLWSGLQSVYNTIASTISSAFTTIATTVVSSTASFSQTVASAWSAGIAESAHTIAGATQAADAAAEASQTAANNITQSIGNSIAVIGAIYKVYDLFSNLDSLFKQGTVAGIGKIISTVGAIVSLIPGIGWIIGGIMSAIGSIMQMFSDPKIPEIFMSITKNKKAAEEFGRNLDLGTKTTEYDTFTSARVVTPLGVRKVNIHAAEITASEMKKSFAPLLDLLKRVDIQIVDTVNEIDAAMGKAGQTMRYYFDGDTRKKAAEVKQPLDQMNVAAAVRGTYKQVFKIFKESGSEVGNALSTWYDTLIKKFVKSSSKNISKSIAVVSALTAKNEATGKRAIESFMPYTYLADFIAKNIKGVKLGRTAEQVTQEIMDVFAATDIAKEGLKALGAPITNDSMLQFLATINSLGFGVKDAAASLIVYSDTLMKMNEGVKYSGEQLMNIFTNKLNELKQAGKTAMEITGFFTVWGTMAKMFKEASVSFKEADLQTAADMITKEAKASQEAAKAAVDKAIAENKLKKITRESAIATLIKAGKLEEATAIEADYGANISKLTKTMLNSMGFISQLASVVGKSLGDMGVSATQWVAAAKNVEKVFGSLEDASKWLSSTLQTFMSPSAFASFQFTSAQAQAKNLAASMGLEDFGVAQVEELFSSSEKMAAFIKSFSDNSGEAADALVKAIDAVAVMKSAMETLSQEFDSFRQVFLGDKAFGKLKLSELKKAVTEAQKLVPEMAGMSIKEMQKSFADFAQTATVEDFSKMATSPLGKLADSVMKLTEYEQSLSDAAADTADAVEQLLRPFQEKAGMRALSDDMKGYVSELYSVRDALETTAENALTAGVSLEEWSFLFDQTMLDFEESYAKSVKAIEEGLAKLVESADDAANKLATFLTDELSDITSDIAKNFPDLKKQLETLYPGVMTSEKDRIQSKITSAKTPEESIAAWAEMGDLLMSNYDKAKDKIQEASDEIEKLTDDFKSLTDSIQSTRDSIKDAINSLKVDMGLMTQTDVSRQQEALIRQRLAASTDPQEQIQLVEDLKGAIVSRYEAEKEAIEETKGSLEDLKDVAKTIQDYIKGLKLSDKSILSNQAKLNEARSQYQETLMKAKGGDIQALQEITNAADAYLEQGKSFFASSPEYAKIFNEVTRSLQGLGGGATESVEVTQAKIKEIQSKALTELEALDPLLTKIQTEQDAIFREQVAKQQGIIDEQKIAKEAIVGELTKVLTALNTAKTDAMTQAEIDKVTLATRHDQIKGLLETIRDNTGKSITENAVSNKVDEALSSGGSTIKDILDKVVNPDTTVKPDTTIPATVDVSMLGPVAGPESRPFDPNAIIEPIMLADELEPGFGVRRFAKGGAFTNGIVTSPTNFGMGQMGEAGPEAVMPLSRTADGSLGVSGGSDLIGAINSLADRIEASDEEASERQITELKALVRTQVATAQALIERLDKMTGSLTTMERKSRLEATA